MTRHLWSMTALSVNGILTSRATRLLLEPSFFLPDAKGTHGRHVCSELVWCFADSFPLRQFALSSILLYQVDR